MTHKLSLTEPLNRLQQLGCQYAFYYQPPESDPFFQASQQRFPSASIIKVPVLLAWIALEQAGAVSRYELCDLDAEPQVQGAGFSWLLRQRQLPYQDVLLMMIATSDNLCTNLIIRKTGLERLNRVFRDTLGLRQTTLERKLFDYAARDRGLDNWVGADDCVRLYTLIEELPETERAWVESMLAVNQDAALLKRNIPRDTVDFYHKTGSIEHVLHDWGYTRRCRIFLLTQDVAQEPAVFEIFGKLGELMLE
jgi:beta-lactamase class A